MKHKELLVTGSKSGSASLWNSADGQFRGHLTGHIDQVVDIDCHPGLPNMVVTASWDQSINVYDISKLPEVPKRFIK
jgi:WD40 repeat protein